MELSYEDVRRGALLMRDTRISFFRNLRFDRRTFPGIAHADDASHLGVVSHRALPGVAHADDASHLGVVSHRTLPGVAHADDARARE